MQVTFQKSPLRQALAVRPIFLNAFKKDMAFRLLIIWLPKSVAIPGKNLFELKLHAFEPNVKGFAFVRV